MILNAVAEKLKRQSKDDFRGRHFEAWVIVQAVTWYLRYPFSYGDLEEMFQERGFEVDHNTINRLVLTYVPMIEKRLRQFRRPHWPSPPEAAILAKLKNRGGTRSCFTRLIARRRSPVLCKQSSWKH